MKNLIAPISLIVLAVAFIVLVGIRTFNADQTNNLKWAQCETKFEASTIPFEGRANFMQDCFEN